MGIFKYSVNKELNEQMPYLMWICGVEQIGIKTYTRLQTCFSSPKELYMAGEDRWVKSGVFSKKQVEALALYKETACPQKMCENMLSNGIGMVSVDEAAYPDRLREIPASPIAIFYKGTLPPKGHPSVAVIGARACTNYGIIVAKKLGEALAAHGVSVISGMARGIDSESQWAAVLAGGYSVAVLGGGVDVVYPKESVRLYEALAEKGCVMSEHVPGTMPKGVFFAQRNRIISGLSDVICVVEAREKSGTMITIDAALEQGREVYVIPGRITDALSLGCLEMIKQGAGIITNIDEFAEETVRCYSYEKSGNDITEASNILGKTLYKEEKGPGIDFLSGLSDEEKKMIGVLPLESFNIDEIIERTGYDYGKTILLLMRLETAKIVDNTGGGRFLITDFGVTVFEKLRKIFLAS